jgi:hypothetical protein
MSFKKNLWISLLVLTTFGLSIASHSLLTHSGTVQRADGGSPIPPPPPPWTSVTPV